MKSEKKGDKKIVCKYSDVKKFSVKSADEINEEIMKTIRRVDKIEKEMIKTENKLRLLL